MVVVSEHHLRSQHGDRADDVLACALDWYKAGKGAVLATVIDTWTASPDRVGSQWAMNDASDQVGSLAGGAIEDQVVKDARIARAEGTTHVVSYTVTDLMAFAAGQACGGVMRVLLEPVGADLLEAHLDALVSARAARQPVAYAVNLDTWDRQLLGPDDPQVQDRFLKDQSGIDGSVFFGLHVPVLRLVVVGAVATAAPLVEMARLAGYETLVIDPRDAGSVAQHLPEAQVLREQPGAVLTASPLDRRSALVTLSHNAEIDDPALIAALHSQAFYIGCLGSKRSHAKRLTRLARQGFCDEALARLHGPVGLDIGAQTPAEIAVSILAELTQHLRRAGGAGCL